MIHRIELFSVQAAAPADAVGRLEAALIDAPRHTGMMAARLGRSGTDRHGWTHVWEQDYWDSAALDAYMADGHHWSVLDPFFDAGNPEVIVERVTVAAYDAEQAVGHGDEGDAGIRRILLIRLAESAGGTALTRLGDAIGRAAPRLPLRASRVAPLLPHRHGWSLVWEQTFPGDDALAEYMRHPAHWAGVDPLFDAENPDVVVARTTMAWYRLPGVG